MKKRREVMGEFAADPGDPRSRDTPSVRLKESLVPFRAWCAACAKAANLHSLGKTEIVIPDYHACSELRGAILEAANAIRPTIRKRDLSEAIKTLETRTPRSGSGVRRLLTAIYENLKNHEGWKNIPKLERIAIELFESQQLRLKPDAHMKLKQEFLDAVKEYQKRALSGKPWRKQDESLFTRLRDFLSDPSDTNRRAQVAEMLLIRRCWCDKWVDLYGDLVEFLHEAKISNKGLPSSESFAKVKSRKRAREYEMERKRKFRAKKKGTHSQK